MAEIEYVNELEDDSQFCRREGLMNRKQPKDDHAQEKKKAQADDEQPVVVNVARMAEALRGPFVTVPPGLTREEKRKFILSHAK